jgi:hypothetical protein
LEEKKTLKTEKNSADGQIHLDGLMMVTTMTLLSFKLKTELLLKQEFQPKDH